jgi:hypothetical protein
MPIYLHEGGDYIKLQLNGDAAPALGASFGGLLFDTSFEPNLAQQLAGDYNSDSIVDTDDYIVWRKTLGQSGFFLPADGDTDHQVDADDHSILRAHFGDSDGNGFDGDLQILVAAPEPNSLFLTLVGGALCCIRRAIKRPRRG